MLTDLSKLKKVLREVLQMRKTKVLRARVSKDLHDQYLMEAHAQGVKISVLIRKALEDYFHLSWFTRLCNRLYWWQRRKPNERD